MNDRKPVEAGQTLCRILRSEIRRISKSISPPRLGEEVPRLGGIIFEFFAKPADMSPQVFEFVSIFWTPNRSQKLDVGDNSALAFE
jgi:hypothetical protein